MPQKTARPRTLKKTTAQKSEKLKIPKTIRKRDGSIVAFETERIAVAVAKAIKASGEQQAVEAPQLVKNAVVRDLSHILEHNKHYVPVVEEIQDLVERQLILHRFASGAKSYILYREKRSELRRGQKQVPEKIKELNEESKQYFRSPLSEFVFYTSYSRWIVEENRRETWVEAIDRYITFMRETTTDKLTEKEYAEIREYMLGMKALGSMRLLWGAGNAARKTNVTAYNCAFTAPRSWKDIAEIMYVSTKIFPPCGV
jgi:ribonucleotide reductase alpha subunit